MVVILFKLLLRCFWLLLCASQGNDVGNSDWVKSEPDGIFEVSSCQIIIWRTFSCFWPASWSSGNAFVSGAKIWGSNLGPVKSDTELPTACLSPPLRHFFKRSCVAHKSYDGLRKLVTRFGVIQRVQWKIWSC